MSDTNEDTSGKIDERRSEQRRPPAVEPTYVWISISKRIRARVSDESTGGIGLDVEAEHRALFEAGFQVRVQHGEMRRTANIAYVVDSSEAEKAVFHVGLEWAD